MGSSSREEAKTARWLGPSVPGIRFFREATKQALPLVICASLSTLHHSPVSMPAYHMEADDGSRPHWPTLIAMSRERSSPVAQLRVGW